MVSAQTFQTLIEYYFRIENQFQIALAFAFAIHVETFLVFAIAHPNASPRRIVNPETYASSIPVRHWSFTNRIERRKEPNAVSIIHPMNFLFRMFTVKTFEFPAYH